MPAPASIIAPVVGDPTRQEFAQATVDWIAYFNSLVNSSLELVPNGSFEFDADNDGEPDAWVIDEFTGGTFLLDESTVAADDKSIHGKRAAKFTSIGGGGNGGGTLTSAEFIQCSQDKVYLIQWQTKSSAAGVRNLLQIEWFDSTQTTISTSTIFDEAVANPTAWMLMHAIGIAPTNARYFKIIFTCADDSDTTAGSVWLDDVRLARLDFQLRTEYKAAGEYYWKGPTGIRLAYVILEGGSGGGGDASGGGNASAGGGAGGLCQAVIAVYPGTLVTVTVGAAGTAGSSSVGGNGGSSTFSTLTAGGGTGGAQLGGAGGAGGTASGGQINTTGNAGSVRVSTNVGGDGGDSVWSGDYGPGGGNGDSGKNATIGGGGGGSGNSGLSGGTGAPGRVMIFW